MLQLFTDTDTDITPAIAKEYGYKLISMPYSIDEKTIYPYEDFDEFEAKPFYDMLRGGALPNTCSINTEKYISYFEPEFEKGNDILYIHFSRKLSMTFDNMDHAVEELLKKYPERKFYSVDTKGIAIVSLNILMEAGDMYKAGATAEEIVAWVEQERLHFAEYFFVDDLKFFKRSGRVSGLAATMGTVIGIKPIIYMDAEGRMLSIGKEVGRQKSLKKILSYMDELGDDIKGHRVIIGHTDYPEAADEIRRILLEKYGEDLDLQTVYVNPTAGCHCGPNAVGITFHSKCR